MDDTAHGMWAKLEELYSKKSLMNWLMLMKMFYTIKNSRRKSGQQFKST